MALGVVAAVEGAVVLRVIQSASNAAEWMSVEQSLAQETSSLARRVMADPYRRPAASDDDTDTARTTAAGPERAAALGAESPAIRA
ncbi:MAG TPA: hypothetical protein VL588_05165, partial [Bdellovibrionota bacterium]|nr:hypothetical protein [Bdellovibrionota bacterium]